ncbi:unknown protein [Oryza sativa Japonica Group]|jgi:hypothetical protein|uniref:Os01g0939400 protein n=5 Tax=Oryza TaxID=4527 RepID=Q5JMJ0_ORYSJ|nr:early nodulin-20 [Oryza sativa Japonica Group]XP_052136682.1 early nodulin-20 [Oryza glaberrima]KAB8085139.1 hypothetical protein EE612_007884 [Oryza sativa]EEE55979.1 hypothetical protein OsJ_04714 [Oryza sativa Japonica Group]KAF2954237.1 hypothetical protein DAI22_01g466100 [Oryza sativa Japonica Group]BAD87317.1 unknown protein [Oryza sativa Japonica Group]BAD87609.1 unknown protein [Oryza sativa Japonica Group]|eukprot:NP_001045348.1 Os01g0939400 [Oryza sativa Japonica Group]
MSLVAYDASSDEEDAGGEPPAAAAASPAPVPSSFGPRPRPPSPSTSVGAAPQPPPHSQNISSTSSSNISLPTPSLDLPDVADLFSSPSLPSRGSTSMMDSTSRKRESNGSAFQDPRSKFPRVQSGQSRGARIAAGNTLVPPQLSGRSNVVTEDMTKLFVARRKE